MRKIVGIESLFFFDDIVVIFYWLLCSKLMSVDNGPANLLNIISLRLIFDLKRPILNLDVLFRYPFIAKGSFDAFARYYLLIACKNKCRMTAALRPRSCHPRLRSNCQPLYTPGTPS